MFNVAMYDRGVRYCKELFDVTPVVVYDPWRDYAGVAVWPCNMDRTYSLPGEPTDERWQGVFSDPGDITAVNNALYELLKRTNPDAEQRERQIMNDTIKRQHEETRAYVMCMTGKDIDELRKGRS